MHGDTAALPIITTELDEEDESPIAPLRASVAEQLGLDSTVLEFHRAPGSDDVDSSVALLVFVPPDPDRLPAPDHAWRAACDIDLLALPVPVRARAAQWLNEATGNSPVPALRAAWSRPGWHARATR